MPYDIPDDFRLQEELETGREIVYFPFLQVLCGDTKQITPFPCGQNNYPETFNLTGFSQNYAMRVTAYF